MSCYYHANFRANQSSVISWKDKRYRCSLGKKGLIPANLKREGDNKSPIGEWPIRRVFYRPDRLNCPLTQLETCALSSSIGWSDDPKDKENYNRLVRLPYAYSHEKLWRDDGVYDIIVELGYNDQPPIPGLGSAIFMHIKRNDYEGTEGCVALAKEHLLELLDDAQVGDYVKIS